MLKRRNCCMNLPYFIGFCHVGSRGKRNIGVCAILMNTLVFAYIERIKLPNRRLKRSRLPSNFESKFLLNDLLLVRYRISKSLFHFDFVLQQSSFNTTCTVICWALSLTGAGHKVPPPNLNHKCSGACALMI